MTYGFIFDAVRSPRGKGNRTGSLNSVTSIDLSAQMINAILSRNGIANDNIEDVIWGNVTQIGEQGGCIARAAILLSQLDDCVPGLSINRFCASGLESVNLAAMQTEFDSTRAYLAGGVEMMSRVPLGSDGAAMAVDPRIAIDAAFVPQGISADLIATEWGFSREECDIYALKSQQRASTAWSERRFAHSIIPVHDINGIEILGHDEHIRPNTNLDTLASLEPSFADIGLNVPGFDKVAILKYPHLEQINHVHHPGNSSGIVDGAAAVLIGSQAFGEANSIKPKARIVSIAKVGSEPTIMLTGPIASTKRALEKVNMEIADIDLFEVNEAFAAIPLMFKQEFDIDENKLNVNGGAISMGHPLGATGAMLVSTAVDELERADLNTALVTLCVGGGMGVTTIIERV